MNMSIKTIIAKLYTDREISSSKDPIQPNTNYKSFPKIVI